MEGGIYIEAKGLDINQGASCYLSEDPLLKADKLFFRKEKNRRFLYNSWKLKSSNKSLNLLLLY